MKANNRLHLLKLFMLTVAGIINAFGVTLFLAPVKLYDSGISGTSMLLSQITPEYLSLSLFLLLLNVPLFLYGLKRQGGLFTFYAIYTVAVYSIMAWLITDVLPIDVSFASPLAGTDLLLCALFGGIVIDSWILPLYSIVTYAAALKTVDFIVEGFDRSKCAIIVTGKPEVICQALSDTFGSGMTRVDGRGGFSNTYKAMIYFVVNRFQVVKMKDIVHEIDPHAYITISEVADVFSRNMDQA